MKKHIGKLIIISIWILCIVAWCCAIYFTDVIEAWSWYFIALTAFLLVLITGATLISLYAVLFRKRG